MTIGKSTPTAPTVADPTTVANAQAAANTATADEQQKLNQVGSSGPDGTVKWVADPSQPGGYSQVTTLSAPQQGLYNSGVQTQQGALNIANQQLGRVGSALGTSVDPSSYGTLQTSAAGPAVQSGYQAQAAQTSYDPGGAITSSIAPSGSIQSGVTPYGSIQNSVAPTAGNISYGYNNGGAIQNQVGSQNINQSVNNASNAAYSQATSRLDPQFNQEQEQLQASLASQGLNSNDAAYQTAMTNFNNTKTDAYNQANYSAIGAGDTEQNTLYGQQLSSGQFANAAQLQGNTENASAAAFNNAAQGQNYNQNLSSMQAANAAQAQGYGQNLTSQQAANAAQAQQYSQNANNATFANTAQAQQNTQNAAQAELYNQGAAQNTSNSLNAAQLTNSAQNQAYNQSLQNAGLNNAAQQQAYTQGTNNANQPINQLSALLGLGQVQSPTSAVYTPTSVNATNVIGAYGQQQTAEEAQYQAQLSQQNSLLNGLAGLGGAAITKYSDIRLKRDVLKLSEEPDGLGIYAYRYLWDDEPQIGVMAHEVATLRPHAYRQSPEGFGMVDYGAL